MQNGAALDNKSETDAPDLEKVPCVDYPIFSR